MKRITSVPQLVLGMAFGWGTAAVNFHLGSSLSSQGKDGTINSFMDRVTR